MDNEHLLVLPINLLNHCKAPDVIVEILENFYNAFRTPIFLLRNISRVGIPKFTVLLIIFRFFMWPLSLINAVPQSIIHLQCIKMLSPKRQDHRLQARWTMEFFRHPLILSRHLREIKIAVTRLSSK